ncbi:MAG: hypothetical protein BWX70_00859 [Verrucomicrobia bacterium ADurb.Bin070]|nr:MAG: hypothetical protein BWX70_00859 [Verrucomicrobia bacterium ADurb.Bin070]
MVDPALLLPGEPEPGEEIHAQRRLVGRFQSRVGREADRLEIVRVDLLAAQRGGLRREQDRQCAGCLLESGREGVNLLVGHGRGHEQIVAEIDHDRDAGQGRGHFRQKRFGHALLDFGAHRARQEIGLPRAAFEILLHLHVGAQQRGRHFFLGAQPLGVQVRTDHAGFIRKRPVEEVTSGDPTVDGIAVERFDRRRDMLREGVDQAGVVLLLEIKESETHTAAVKCHRCLVGDWNRE